MAAPRSTRPQRLGDQLIQRGVIDEQDLKVAVDEQKRSGLALGETLVESGRITEQQLTDVVAENYGIEAVDPRQYWVEPQTAKQLPEEAARRFCAVILEETDDHLLVATADPGDIMALDEIERILPKRVEFRLAGRKEITDAINLAYTRGEEIERLADEVTEELQGLEDLDLSDLSMNVGKASSPAVRLLKTLMEDAVQQGISDIHIEPDDKVLRIRSRRDGILQERLVRQASMQNGLVSLLKLMANLNITERRLPQDGRFNTRIQGRNLDVRLSTLPQQYGESVVLRLLDQGSVVSSLDETGMSDAMLGRFRRQMGIPNGVILVTGPTGSGKSTTLYGALGELNSTEVKIITVEDPVEYALPRVTQVQIREQIGLDFSRVLRTALRQDPDIVMVGEIRDSETAEVAMRAAITGHRVFSTLHTNDAISTTNRLLDMGVEPFMLAAALRGVVAQRLLRRVCSNCARQRPPTDDEIAWLKHAGDPQPTERLISEGQGCQLCGQTGYNGRVGLFEMLELNDAMRDALRAADLNQFSRLAHESPAYQPMQTTALEFIQDGITNIVEVIRVLGDTTPEEP